MAKTDKKKIGNPIYWSWLETPPPTPEPPENEYAFYPKGYEKIVEAYKDMVPASDIAKSEKDMQKEWNKLIALHSPLTPAEASRRASIFVAGINAASGIMTTGLIAAEAIGLMQMESPAMLVPQIPIIRSSMDTAVQIQKIWFDAVMVKAASYQYQYDHKPTLVPENVVIDLFAKGIITVAEYVDYMGYYGYTYGRASDIYKSTMKPPSTGTIIDLLKRRWLTKEGAIDWLEWNRIPRPTAEGIIKLAVPLAAPSLWATAMQKEWIEPEAYDTKMKEYGFTDLEAMFQYWASERPPPLETILELDRRGLIEEPWKRELYTSTMMQGWAVDWVTKLKIQFPEPYRLAEMASKGIMPEKEMVKYMGYFGLIEEHGKMWTEAQQMRPTLGMLNSMYWRKAIDAKEWSFSLRRTGFTTAAIKQLESLRYVIAPLPDLINMAVKEAFGEHTYKEQLPALIEWGGKMGLSKEWVERYWYAHWDRIALREMYSNLWRGHWTKEEFMRMLRIKDVHPDDREAIYKVAFLPPSIRELGYGYDMGVYDIKDITRYRRMGGLSPDDAGKAAQSLILYRTSAEIEAIRREWLWLYARERITKKEFTDALVKLKTPAEAIPLWLERGDLQIIRFKQGTITEEGRLTTATEAVWAFKNKLRDEKWLRARLEDLDWTPDRINLAVEKAKLQMIETPEPEPEVTYRKLTLSQIQAMYRRGMITDEDLPNYLIAIGYSAYHADMLRELTHPEPEAISEAKRLTISNIRSFYDMRIISRADIPLEIEKLGYTPEDAKGLALNMVVSVDFPDLRARYSKGWLNDEELIAEIWELGLEINRAIELAETIIKAEIPERTIAEKNLTKSEIVKGVKVGILEATEAVKLIERLGYDEYEAWYVLLVNKAIDEPEKMSYWNWRQIVEAWRRAQGLQWQEIPDDLVALDFTIMAMKKQIETEKAEDVAPERIAELTVKLGAFQTQLRHRLIALGLD